MNVIHTPNLHEGTVAQKRAELLAYFHDSFDTYESLFTNLNSDEAFYQRPDNLRHPLIFYYGHTATFFINKLMLAKLINERIDPEFESLFAIGVDEMSWDDLNEAHYDWPDVAKVKAYRSAVREKVSDVISNIEFSLPINWQSPMWTLVMGIEHERIHLETSSVLIRQLDLRFIKPQPQWLPSDIHCDAPTNTLRSVRQGEVKNDKTVKSPWYGWDNEFGYQHENVPEFQASRYLVSNAEFLEFVEAQGYHRSEFWEDEGWKWREFTQARHPVFWRNTDNGYVYRSMIKEMSLPLSWPVDVNYHEAKAFCNFKTALTGEDIRLPTENEWQRLRDESGLDQMRFHENMNINLARAASSEPVTQNAHGDFFDVAGNIWQWTETPIYPFDGFQVHPIYDDFTTPTFDNKHNLIKGGSWISTGNEATRDSRYAFRRHFFQHAGFRYVQSDKKISVNDFDYESDTQVSQYSEFHYGQQFFGVANFAQQSAKLCLEYTKGRAQNKALDLGCAVGRSSFELARQFDEVHGIDFSARFIKTATDMQERKELRYTLIDEGELTSFKSRKLKDFDLEEVAHKVFFSQGDACNLKSQFSGYDLIFLGNLLDRVYSPRKLLTDIQQRLKMNGILVVASPFTWLEEYTERDEWLGGYKDNTGETLTSTAALESALTHCKRIGGPKNIEFVIRETKRKFQHSISEFNIFERVK